MAKSMELEVIVRLRDMLSAGLDGVGKKLQHISGIAQSMGRGLADLGARLANFGIAASVGFAAGLKSAVDFDTSLRDTAITLDLSGKAAEDYIQRTGKALESMTKRTGQTSAELAGSLKDLVAAGIDEAPAFKMIDQIGKVATASAATVKDLTTTSKVLFQSFGVGADEMELALAKLHRAGKLGNFELRDIAQFAPEIAPNLGAIGVKGMEGIAHMGAALQIAKMGAGTPGEAATNYKDFVSQITSSHFKKRAADAGFDVDGVMKDAAVKGINPVEAVLQKIIKATNADGVAKQAAAEAKRKGMTDADGAKLIEERVSKAVSGSKLGEILINQQSKTFFATFAAHVDDYLKIKSEITKSGKDVIGTDFDTRMNGPEAKLRMASEEIEQTMRRFGKALLPAIDNLGSLAEKAHSLTKWADEALPGMVDKFVQLGSAVMGVIGVMGALRFLGLAGTPGAPAVPGAPGVPAAVPSAVGAAVPAFVAAGGLALAWAAAKQLENNPGLRDDLTANTMTGALGGDASFSAGILNAGNGERSADPWGKFVTGLPGAAKRFLMPDEPLKPRRIGRGGQDWSAPQKVDVNASVTVKVDGPGQVVGQPQITTSEPDRGTTSLRP